jgi:hypothetical protein
MFSTTPVTRRGNYLDTLCATLEEKMMYGKGERDMVMLQHKFEVELKDGTKVKKKSQFDNRRWWCLGGVKSNKQNKKGQRNSKSETSASGKLCSGSALFFFFFFFFFFGVVC